MQETGRIRIEELRLTGFRAFENARLSLDDMTVLVGRNGAGKSTLIDAFDFLREALTDSLENALERRGGIRAVLHRGPRAAKRLAIAVTLRLPSELVARYPHIDFLLDPGKGDTTIAYGFVVQSHPGGMGFRVALEEIRSSTEFQYTMEGGVWDLANGATRSPPTALQLPTVNRDTELGVILEALRTSFRTYKLSPAAIRAEPPVGPASLLHRDGGNAGDVLKHIEKSKQDLAWIVKHLGAITPGISSVQSGTAAGRRLVQFFQSSGGRARTRFNIGDMSDGTLRCLAILLALRQQPAPAVVCIDEIEDSVHPAALAVLLDAVLATTERSQVLLTSHSPEALSHPAVTAGHVRVVEWHDGKSEIFRLSAGAEQMSRPPRSVGKLLRTNALFTADHPERVDGDLFKVK